MSSNPFMRKETFAKIQHWNLAHPLAAVMAMAMAILLAPSVRAERYALLVGNMSYPNLGPRNNQLRGCENDARLMYSLLTSRLGMPAKNVEMLLDSQATKQGIFDGLNRLIERSAPGDSLLLYFSGHGFQVPDKSGDEEDRKDEVLAVYDMRFLPGGELDTYILDDELNDLIARKAADRRFVAIFDCCHSGTGLRNVVFEPAQATRHIKRITPPDETAIAADKKPAMRGGGASRPARMTNGFFNLPVPAVPAPRAGAKSASPPAGGWALIAASRDSQSAAEDTVEIDGRPRMQGLATEDLYNFFSAHPRPREITFADLKARLDREIVMEGNSQNPQVEVSSEALMGEVFLAGAPAASAQPASTSPPSAQPASGSSAPSPAPGTPNPPAATTPAQNEPSALRKVAVAFEAQGGASEPAAMRDLREMTQGMKQIARVVETKESYALLVLCPPDSVAIADGAGRVIRENIPVRDARAELRRQITRAFIGTNLAVLRQSVASSARIELDVMAIEEKDAKSINGTGRSRDWGRKSKTASQREFRVNEATAFTLIPSHDGYLTLININCEGHVNLLYPDPEMKANKSGWIRGGEKYVLSGIETEKGFDPFIIMPDRPTGKEFLKAFLTPAPIRDDLAQAIQAAGEGDADPDKAFSFIGRVGELTRDFGRKKNAGSVPASPAGSGGAGTAAAGAGAATSGGIGGSAIPQGQWAEATLEVFTSK